MKKIAFVSSADEKYFPLLAEWLQSIRRFDQSREADICILSAGLSDPQIRYLKSQGCKIIIPEWPMHLASHKIKNKEFLKACLCRPYLPEYFPGYQTYIWLDADTWLQDWEAVDLLVQGASKNALAICPQTDRAYGKAMRLEWLGPFPFKAKSFYYSNARRAFSSKIARRLFPYPTLNAGVFALSANAPHWKAWQGLIEKALKRGKVFTAEQLTLGMLVYLENYRAEFLPAWCNWLCQSKPVWNPQSELFLEPYLPHHKIGIMHLSGYDEMRLDRAVTTEVQTTGDEKGRMSLRYPLFDGEAALADIAAAA